MRARRTRAPHGILLVALLMLEGSGAFAETEPPAKTVILLQPTTASGAVRRSLARIRDEVSADRYRVIVADSSTADPGALIESAAKDPEGNTILALFGDPEAGQAELCVVHRAAGRTAVRQATVASEDPERMPDALAARALELVRATVLELSIDVDGRRAQGPPEPKIEAETASKTAFKPEPAVSPTPSTVAAMGVGIWNSLDGPPAALTPVLRVGLRLSEWAWLRVSLAGLGTRPRVDATHGSAALSQSVGLAETVAVFRRDKRVQPTLSLGAGALHLAVAGTGAAPYESREPRHWSVAFDAGVGLAFAIGARAALATELHALLAAPHPVVRVADTRAATIGYPSLILTLALQVAP